MCCSIQKTNDQRKKFFFRPKNFPSFRLILRFSVSADMKKVCIRLRSVAGKEDSRASALPTWSGSWMRVNEVLAGSRRKSLCSKREFCPEKDVTVLSFYLNPV